MRVHVFTLTVGDTPTPRLHSTCSSPLSQGLDSGPDRRNPLRAIKAPGALGHACCDPKWPSRTSAISHGANLQDLENPGLGWS